MDYEVLMPQFSDTMETGKVVCWLKKEGDFVEEGEVIAHIEAEKAVMELQSFKRGTIKRILVQEGPKARAYSTCRRKTASSQKRRSAFSDKSRGK